MYQNTNRELHFVTTQKCNYQCTFCHGEGLQTKKDAMLTPSDIQFIFKTGKKNLNLDTTTLSGGEPLVRSDIIEIAKLLRAEEAKITLTTNGSLLDDRLEIG